METASPYILESPWDTRAFGIHSFEITRLSEEVLRSVSTMRGHFTVKVDPLDSKELLERHDFYYCDTLIEPWCRKDRFISHHNERISLIREDSCGELSKLVQGSFQYDRFHRDFHIETKLADLRYENWLQDLCRAGKCRAFLFEGAIAGFFCAEGSRIILHALSERFRNKGLSKFFWSTACSALFSEGHDELTSSISAANMPVLNLYASLGFRFRNPRDVYHCYRSQP